MKRRSKPLSAALAVAIALVLLAGAVAVPILCRPFYYAHIRPLELAERTGFTEEQIKTAFDQMLDYCLGAPEFATGDLRWSESGRDHFTDVRGLFLLDLRVLAAAAAALIALLVWAKIAGRTPAPLLGRGPAFWAGAGLGGVFLLLGGLAALDFDRAFVVFHALFFPGKTNWLFDPQTDQIILILPEVFFRNCALLILGVLALGCAGLIAFDLLRGRGKGGARAEDP